MILGGVSILEGLFMRKRLVGIVAVVLFAAASQASAATVDVTYTGTVYKITDLTNIFDNAYIGESFTSTYVVDTPNGVNGSYTNSSITTIDYKGGPGYGNPNPPTISPIVSVTVTIGGVSVSLPINQYGEATISQFASGSSYESDQVNSYQGGVNIGVSQNATVSSGAQAIVGAVGTDTIPLSFDEPLNISSLFYGNQNVSFDTTYPQSNAPDKTFVDTVILGTVSSINVSATPLPSTWTMLIAGFVGLGLFAYRGSKKNAAAIAAA
jgi:hypothetical protein